MYPPTSWPYALFYALSTEVASCKKNSLLFFAQILYFFFLIFSYNYLPSLRTNDSFTFANYFKNSQLFLFWLWTGFLLFPHSMS